MNTLIWTKRAPGLDWSQDAALIASFAMFTIALIPIIWIYGFAATRARWIVLGFGAIKIGLWFHGFSVVTYSPASQLLRFFEPGLIIAALILLFTSPTKIWLHHDPVREIAKFN